MLSSSAQNDKSTTCYMYVPSSLQGKISSFHDLILETFLRQHVFSLTLEEDSEFRGFYILHLKKPEENGILFSNKPFLYSIWFWFRFSPIGHQCEGQEHCENRL